MRASKTLLLLLFLLFAHGRAMGAPHHSKLRGHLHIVKNADRKKLKAMSRFLGIEADAAIPRIHLLIRLNPGYHKRDLARAFPGIHFESELGGVVTAAAPTAELDGLENSPAIERVEISRRSKPTLDVVRSTQKSGGYFLGVLENAADLASAAGAGVIVGVIDTGIDYTHKDFQDSSNNTRLISIWDQCDTSTLTGGAACTNTSANAPVGYTYGLECTPGGAFPTGITNGTCSERDYNGHGTNVMGIAAGNGRAFKDNGVGPNKYVGMAPQADLIMVRSDFDDYHVMNAVTYLVQKAASLGKKLVINLSIGGQSGPHDGTDVFESAIGVTASTVPIAVAMGNDNADSPHSFLQFQAGQARSTTVNTTNTSGYASYTRFIDTEFWYDASDDYALDVSVAGGPAGILHWNVQEGGVAGTSKCFPLSTVCVYVANAGSGSSMSLFVEVDDNNTGGLTQVFYKLTRSVSGGSGNVDGYTQPAILGTSFANNIAGYGTITRPSTADNVFSVAAYNTKNTWPLDSLSAYDPIANCGTGNISYALPLPALGIIADFSGNGPRRNGAQNAMPTGTNGAKPDIAAPGQGIASSLSLNSNPNTCFVVDDGVHFVDQGTSQATPVVTGVLAAMLGVNPALTVSQLRSALQATARTDGAEGAVPNNVWGPGKVVGAPTKVRVAPSPISSQVLGTSSITFTWSTVANATSYNLYNSFVPHNFLFAQAGNSKNYIGLSPNTLYGVDVLGQNGYGEGPSANIFVAATLANQAVPSLTQTFASSITVTFAAGVGGAGGFALYATTAADTVSGTVFSSVTASGAVTQLSVSGLANSTQYCLRLDAKNQSGVPTGNLLGCFTTTNPYSPPPIVNPPSILSSSQIQFAWLQGSNPNSVNYSADASTAANFTGTLTSAQGVDMFATIFSGLLPDTSYYFRVKANVSLYSSTGPYATHTGPASSVATPFVGISSGAVVANWSRGSDPADALFRAEASTDPTSAFYPVVSSSQTANALAGLTGLSPNTTYFVRVTGVSRDGVLSSPLILGSFSTLGSPPVPTIFTGVTTSGLTGNFTSINGPGTVYVGQISVDPTAAFSPVFASSQTANLFASFTGLASNQLYFFRAGTIGNAGGVNYNSFATEISAYTLPATPVAAAPVAAPVSPTSEKFFWGAGTNAAGTTYAARICSDALCGGVIQTISGIAALNQVFAAGLSANTTYFGQVQALHNGGVNPDSAFVLVGSSPTFANPPPGATVVQPVQFTSFTVVYPTLPAGPQAATCEGYRVQAALDSGFTNIAFTTDIQGSGTGTAAITNLAAGTTYWVRVGSLNWDGDANYTASVSTRTLIPIQTSGTITGNGLSLSVNPVGVPVTNIQLVIPPATLPTGIAVTLNTTVSYFLPSAVSNEASLTQVSPSLGFTIDAAGMQPVKELVVVLTYDPLQLPIGKAARDIQLARYDTASSQWTLLPTTVDTTQNRITARINHFSLFAPFFVSAGGDLSNVNIFPVPWEPGTDNANLNAAALTISNLPASSSVKITALNGALVWSGVSGTNGVLTWDGKNRFSRPVGSGTYLILIENGGAKTVRRAVLLR